MTLGKDETRSGSPYLLSAEVAARYRLSLRSVHEMTRRRRIPFRRLAGSRRCLFHLDDLRAWENGAPLEVVELAGGLLVRPCAATADTELVYRGVWDPAAAQPGGDSG
jgi:hypothetical protein